VFVDGADFTRHTGVKTMLKQQTSVQPTTDIERQIAASLKRSGSYRGKVSSDELGAILTKVLYSMVEEQKVAGINVPIHHNVSDMNVAIDGGAAAVSCAIQVRNPINARIKFNYVLENDHTSDGKRLKLRGNQVDVEEITRPLDVSAKVALKAMGVRQIARQELRDPNGIIQRVLPAHLREQGFHGKLADVHLVILDDDTVGVFIAAEKPGQPTQ
jgi:hypothetical protein